VLLRPLSGAVGWDNAFTVEGQSPETQAGNPSANYEAISPDYFRTMRIPLVAGRDFSDLDREGSQGVVIVNESAARRFWGMDAALGKRLKLGRASETREWLTVVGVVKDVRYREWETARTDLYIPYRQRAQHRSDFVVRVGGDPHSLAAAVQREVLAIDPDQPISSVTTMEELVAGVLARPRFQALLLSLFAWTAIVLTLVGVYGVISWSMIQRKREIGIRMALGSRPADILKLILGDGLRMVIGGTAAGVIAAVLLSRFTSRLNFGISTYDAPTYVAALILVPAVATAACLVPAIRAARVNPVDALQVE
jgi:putative ABC transport system permease protein